MIPTSSRHVIVALSAIFVLGFLWYRRKKSSGQSDPGGTEVGTENTDKRSLVVHEEKNCTIANTSVFSRGTSVDPSESVVKALEKSVPKFVGVHKEELLANGRFERVVDFSSQKSSASEVCAEKEEALGSETLAIVVREDKVEESTGGIKVVAEVTKDIKCTDSEVVEEKCEQRTVAVAEAVTVVQKLAECEELIKEVPIVQKTLNPNAEDFILNIFTCSPSIEKEYRKESLSDNIDQVQEDTLTTKDCVDLTSDINFRELADNNQKQVECKEAAEGAHNTKSSAEVSFITEQLQEPGAKIRWSSEVDSESENDKTLETILKTEGTETCTDCPSNPTEMARESSSEVECDAPTIENDGLAERNLENGSLESKLSALKLEEESTPKRNGRSENTKVKESNGVERDSANHSPADVMLESPSINNYSDVQSEGSSDSGKGGSDVATPPSRTPASGSSVAGDLSPSSVYEFVLPQILVGRLIGRHGIVVHQIKAKTNANIFIKRHPETNKMKICAIEGTPMDIESALEMIRQKFPLKRFPNVTLEQVSFLPPVTTFPLATEYFQLPLIEGVNNDVVVSSLVTPEHCFLQQPTHPTYLALNRLNVCMNVCYNEPNSPLLPLPVKEDVVCIAPTMGGWYRAQVVTTYPENETCDVRFLDYGGYLNVAQTDLRQIRQDFLTLPFQAAECYLANIRPLNGIWVPEAMALFEQLTHSQVIQAQIHGYADNGIPVVYLFSIQGTEVMVVNQELVNQGYAELYEPTEESADVPVGQVLPIVQQEIDC